MNWDIFDFAVFAAMLLAVGCAYALLRRKAKTGVYRFALGTALATAFILVWVNGAVGIIGSENNDANMLYFGVVGILLVGALLARFRPQGMALALIATAMAQAAVAAYAVVNELGSTAAIWPRDILMLTGFFVALWLLSAWLFRIAARKRFSDRSNIRG